MMQASDLDLMQKRLGDRLWRLNHLYYIQNKLGEKQLFRLNWAQQQLYDDLHFNNIILKARQLGITTFISLLFLDTALFNSNSNCGIIADTEENAKYIFRKIKFAYDSLPVQIKSALEAKIDSAKELTFSNNSLIRVGTSLRSATFQYLLISEFGKIAAEDHKRTNEILTGSLNTIAAGAYCFIESTARGRQGAFFDMCQEARRLQDGGKTLSSMDYRFHFMGWHKHPEYQLAGVVQIPQDLKKYFSELEHIHSIRLTEAQKNWYSAKSKTQLEDILREYPTHADEAFQANVEGHYYAKHITKARIEKRIGRVPYDEMLPVYCAMDLGLRDAFAIWWYQVLGSEIRMVDYFELSGESLPFFLKLIKEKPYQTQRVFAPHDAEVHELSSGLTRTQVARNLGVEFTVLEKLSIQEGIDACRSTISRCWFDEIKCEKGIKALENYRKEWSESLGTWRDQPRHDHFSNGADAFRYAITSLSFARKGMTKEDLDRTKANIYHKTGQSYVNRSGPSNFPGERF